MRRCAIIESMVLSQANDSCGKDADDDQFMAVKFEDAGAGFYPVISTKRWAFGDIDEFKRDYAFLFDICKRNNQLTDARFGNGKDEAIQDK